MQPPHKDRVRARGHRLLVRRVGARHLAVVTRQGAERVALLARAGLSPSAVARALGLSARTLARLRERQPEVDEALLRGAQEGQTRDQA